MNTEQLFDNKYKIIRLLGQGGMSKVFLAENVRLNTLWAIKEIRKDKNKHVDLLAEPNALKKLRHPSLPRIFDIIENDEYIYIIQDYIEGQDVSDLLKQNQKIDEERVLKWAKQIADVYIYLHNLKPNPMIYRDMKPGNLIIDHEDNAKVIDFGIAREYKEGLTEDTTLLGTRGYAAPEQYGTGQTDKRTDIYSLGITLFHILTGIGPNDPEFDTHKLEEENLVSSGMLNVLKKCVENNPAKRFESAEELREALDNVHQWNHEYKKRKQQGKRLKFITITTAILSICSLIVFTLRLKQALEIGGDLWSGIAGVTAGLILGIVSWHFYQKLQNLSNGIKHEGVESSKEATLSQFKRLKANTKPALAFFSPRSTGKTEIACNTALALSKMGKKVILLDLDHVSYGTIYNFPIDAGENYENFFKFKVLINKINDYLSSNKQELNERELKELSLHRQKNLTVYSGNQEIELMESTAAIERKFKYDIEPEILKSDLPKEWIQRIKGQYIEEHLKVSKSTVEYLVKRLVNLCDVLIIDVGRSTTEEVKNYLVRSEYIEKYLITTENIEDLNSIAHQMKMDLDIDYEGWHVVVNKTNGKAMFREKELKQYFYDQSIEFLRFKIKSLTYIPYVQDVWKFKKKRRCMLGYSKVFDQSIMKLINTSIN